MVVGCDVDGVVADFNEGYVKLLGSIAPDVKFPPLSDTYPDTWNYHLAAGITKEQNRKSWDLIREDDLFWFNLNPYPGASGFLVWLKYFSRGNDIYFITNRSGRTAKYQTERFLHKAGYPEPTVILSQEKGAVCNALDINYYIDDKNENCVDVRDNAGRTKGYMLKRGWNTPQQDVPVLNRLVEFQNILMEARLKAA